MLTEKEKRIKQNIYNRKQYREYKKYKNKIFRLKIKNSIWYLSVSMMLTTYLITFMIFLHFILSKVIEII